MRSYYSYFKKFFLVKIIVIGNDVPSALADIKDVIKIDESRLSWPISESYKVGMIARDYKFDILHCFDSSSLLVARWSLMFHSTPVLWTKCGGKTLKRYTPRGFPDIVFHGEDYDFYFKKMAKKKSHDIAIIPNRFSALEFSSGQDGQVGKKKRLIVHDKDCFNIIRVSRISKKYKEGFLHAIKFSEWLCSNGCPAHLYIIGYPEDKNLVLELQSIISDKRVTVVTDKELTRNASRHLWEADAVIASGRGAIESLAMGKLTFISSDKGGLIPLCKETFSDALYYNFSERTPSNESIDPKKWLIQILQSPALSEVYFTEAQSFFKESLDLDSAKDEILDVYDRAAKRNFRGSVVDLLMHSGFLIIPKLRRAVD
ncbi:hypothetical protein [Halomonas sp. Y3]|uniref:hypothetical protein n=1 Tax=Halomonas sp. Y3 TaxID=2956797 RepID=UPI00209FD084|nr:hypothetical protein [Halomonas sp. Y3]